ncbi:MAG TPA: amidohydrolase family protein, partial [Thermoanaerobaculia bacterium]|nr:amidohydrolase family protein [Thermoanaerobaculia bacterium]
MRSIVPLLPVALALVVVAPALPAAEEPPLPSFMEYDPPSTLVVPEHPVPRAKYPFVDVHSHQPRMAEQDLAELVAAMDALHMAVMVNLSGRGFRRTELPDGTVQYGLHGPEQLAAAVANARSSAPGRFIVFTNVDFAGIGTPGWSEAAAAQLAADVAAGAAGLKIYKSLGMSVTDSEGRRVAADDPRLDPIWAKAGELGVPVLVHTADPAPFWQARDGDNERLYELIERPERYKGPDAEPSWEQLIVEQHAVFRRHADTVFINAHLGWFGNDLARLGALLDELPNVYTEIGAVLAELGRQPRFARDWLTRYQDRVLFGKDSWQPDEYPTYFRVLETADDYFPYYRRRHAFWRMYGLDLPDEVLRKIYFENALRIIPGIDRSLFPA